MYNGSACIHASYYLLVLGSDHIGFFEFLFIMTSFLPLYVMVYIFMGWVQQSFYLRIVLGQSYDGLLFLDKVKITPVTDQYY